MRGKLIIRRSDAMNFKKLTKGINEPLFKQSSQFLIHVMALNDGRSIINILHHLSTTNFGFWIKQNNKTSINIFVDWNDFFVSFFLLLNWIVFNR